MGLLDSVLGLNVARELIPYAVGINYGTIPRLTTI